MSRRGCSLKQGAPTVEIPSLVTERTTTMLSLSQRLLLLGAWLAAVTCLAIGACALEPAAASEQTVSRNMLESVRGGACYVSVLYTCYVQNERKCETLECSRGEEGKWVCNQVGVYKDFTQGRRVYVRDDGGPGGTVPAAVETSCSYYVACMSKCVLSEDPGLPEYMCVSIYLFPAKRRISPFMKGIVLGGPCGQSIIVETTEE